MATHPGPTFIPHSIRSSLGIRHSAFHRFPSNQLLVRRMRHNGRCKEEWIPPKTKKKRTHSKHVVVVRFRARVREGSEDGAGRDSVGHDGSDRGRDQELGRKGTGHWFLLVTRPRGKQRGLRKVETWGREDHDEHTLLYNLYLPSRMVLRFGARYVTIYPRTIFSLFHRVFFLLGRDRGFSC